MGTYPARRPAYDTAFLFLGDRFDDANVPPWAMKVVLDEEEFTGEAARSASPCPKHWRRKTTSTVTSTIP